MPPDWKLAENHAKARSTAPDKKKDGANEKGILFNIYNYSRDMSMLWF